MTPETSNETTNAVLKEMIIGLTKITDDRLGNLKDAVAEIKILMQGYATKSEVEEVKRDFNKSINEIKEGFVKHNEADVISFGGLKKGQDDLKTVVTRWGGAIAVVIFLAVIVLPFVFHYLLGW